MHRRCLLLLLFCAAATPGARVPTVDDILNVKSAGRAVISPDGKYVAYTVTEADFQQDAFVSQIWVVETGSRRAFPLTRGKKSAANMEWSPDGKWLAFTSARDGEKAQIYLIHPDGGEAVPITKTEEAVEDLAWSPDSKSVAFLAAEPSSKASKDRKERLGEFTVVRKDYEFRHIRTLDVAEALKQPVPGKQLTKGAGFSVTSLSWAPSGDRIAFSAQRNPDLIQGGAADIYILTLAGGNVGKIVSQPGPDTSPIWSADSRQILFESAMGSPNYFYSNSRLAVVPASGGAPRSLTDSFDEDVTPVAWNGGGIYFSALQKTSSHLFHLDPRTLAIRRVSSPASLIGSGFTMTRDGSSVAFTAASPTTIAEVYSSRTDSFAPTPLTAMTEQVSPYTLGRREAISWKSKDGTTIEGILIKPADFDPGRKYPLLCIIHGGPTGIDRPTLLDARYYPSDIWAGRGALVLKVNYRGSAGYGRKFRELNVRNLGVGDAWDVLSGVDSLISKGWVDPDRIGCMGWSQGGYISAFLTTTSTRFRAISVGAGISDWATYYYNTDITPFTIQYLGADPVADPDIYRKTSPITYVKQARTPTLIQHGELDRRVPPPNGYELRQALEDRGVPVEMIVYKGYGHAITKPKSMRAVMEHNLVWFNHYLWNGPKPDFTSASVGDSAQSSKAESR